MIFLKACRFRRDLRVWLALHCPNAGVGACGSDLAVQAWLYASEILQ